MKELRETILKTATRSHEGHIPSGLSILDIVWVLYDKILNVTPETAGHPDRDRFILSKGNGSLGLYATLAAKKFITPAELEAFCRFDAALGGHPDRNKVRGVEASTGSLGHGFPIAVGTALGLKIRKSPARVFVLVGDGECNEGTIWESALLASHHHLENLCCIVDHNHSTDRALLVDDLMAKFGSFGWETISVNGHDQGALEVAMQKSHREQPLAIIANTIKGHGIPSMENDPAWHHRIPNDEELETFMEEIRAL